MFFSCCAKTRFLRRLAARGDAKMGFPIPLVCIIFAGRRTNQEKKEDVMGCLMNVLWLLLGGVVTALEYLVASLLMMFTVVGIPFGLQTLKLAGLALWPFGKRVVAGERSSGCLHVLFNVVWILVGGVWIALSHLAFGALLCLTVVGIPFGLQHFKLAALALTPFGKDIVEA